MKTFEQISAQMERIYDLWLSGYGCRKMVERCENLFAKDKNVGVLF